MKVQQQRMTDLKKTLQRELKVQALPNDELGENSNLVSQHTHSMSMDSLSSTQTVAPSAAAAADARSSPVPMLQTSGSVTRNMHTNKYIERQLERASPEPVRRATSRRHYEEDVNFAYLKHVVLKFMLSRESEVSYFTHSLCEEIKARGADRNGDDSACSPGDPGEQGVGTLSTPAISEKNYLQYLWPSGTNISNKFCMR